LTAATVAVLTLLGQAAHTELLINVDKSSQRMSEQLYDWPVTDRGEAATTRRAARCSMIVAGFIVFGPFA
jgi:hypothetical protein